MRCRDFLRVAGMATHSGTAVLNYSTKCCEDLLALCDWEPTGRFDGPVWTYILIKGDSGHSPTLTNTHRAVHEGDSSDSQLVYGVGLLLIGRD